MCLMKTGHGLTHRYISYSECTHVALALTRMLSVSDQLIDTSSSVGEQPVRRRMDPQ